MASNNTIELNGKRYDALTGAFLGEGSVPARPVQSATPARHRGRSIDGFVKTASKTPQTVSKIATQPRPALIPVRPAPADTPKIPIEHPKVLRRAHQAAKHTAAHKPERAKTLMRHAVSKPKSTLKPAIKVQAPAEVMVKPVGTIAPKLSVTKIDPSRKHRSQEVKQSETIQKFSPSRQTETVVRGQVAPVRARSIATPVRTSSLAAPTRKTTTPPQDIFEAAIAHATSHQQPAPAHLSRRRRAKRRAINAIAGVAAFLVIGGFVAYLNMPNIELKVASVRAGFSAKLPDYKPVGYTVKGGIQTKSKQITVSFRSDNGSGFKLTQQPSNWNSDTLYDNVVSIVGKQHQTIESNGRKIYLYGDTNATWVNGGIWYQITGNAELSNDQITQLATSI